MAEHGQVRSLVERAIEAQAEVGTVIGGTQRYVTNERKIADVRADADALDARGVIVLPEWTTETPTEPGLYRRKSLSGHSTWWLVAISEGGKPYGTVFGSGLRIELVQESEVEWCGPLVVREAQGNE